MYKETRSGAAATKMADDRPHFVLLLSAVRFTILFYIRRKIGS